MRLQKLVYSKGTQCRAEQLRDVVAAEAQDTPSLTSLNPRKQMATPLKWSCEDKLINSRQLSYLNLLAYCPMNLNLKTQYRDLNLENQKVLDHSQQAP